MAAFTELRRLNLSRTKISDAGIKHLAALSKLEVLNLYGSKVSDAAMQTLAAMPALKRVYVWQTAVSADACAQLRTARPNLIVDRGDYVLQEPPPVEAASDNTLCPVSQKPVDPGIVQEFEGLKVGFCCEMCRAKFAGDPAAYMDALKAHIAERKAKSSDAAPVNKECPVSGKAVDAQFFVQHDGKKVAFCCGNCKAAFEKDPQKYAEKIK